MPDTAYDLAHDYLISLECPERREMERDAIARFGVIAWERAVARARRDLTS